MLSLKAAIAGAVAALTASCSPTPDNNPVICSAPFNLQESLARRDDGTVGDSLHYIRLGDFAKECVHRWAYRLAGDADDPANLVAKAAVGACVEPLERWVSAEIDYDKKNFQIPDPKSTSPLTGETVRYQRARHELLEQIALFHVVQARAGKCRPE